MHMPEDGFDWSGGDARHLTPQQWTELRKSIVAGAHEERSRAITAIVSRMFRAARRLWRSIRIRAEARAALRAMTDHELRDIGLSRSGIEAAIRGRERDTDVVPAARIL